MFKSHAQPGRRKARRTNSGDLEASTGARPGGPRSTGTSILPRRPDSLADELGRVDAISKAAEAESKALKDEFKVSIANEVVRFW